MKKTKTPLTSTGLPSFPDQASPVTTGFSSTASRSVGFMSIEPPSLTSYRRESFPKPSLTPSLNVGERSKPSYQYASSTKTWNVTDATLPTVPDLYPLEVTAVFIPYTPASTVASRIAEVLRERSIGSIYNSTKAKVKCMTSYDVDFRVRLYRGKGTYSHGVIAEVQRRSGFSPYFSADVQAILDGAEGKMECVTSQPHPSVTDNDTQENDQSTSLHLFEELIVSGKKDSELLALSGLKSLTDSREVGKTASAKNTRSFLSREHESLRLSLSDLALKSDAACNQGEDEALVLSRVLAILSNVSRDTDSGSLAKVLLPILLSSLTNAKINTCLAFRSAEILLNLLEKSKEILDSKSHECMNALCTAHSVGKVYNVKLEEISSRCIDLMV